MTGRLIICATPIGNLGDAAPRLADTLASVDVIFAEDTRRTAILLGRLGLKVPLRSYFVGNEAERAGELVSRLDAGETVALVTDAGMPSVADPGMSAVRVARDAGAGIGVVPGPSAVTTALAVSGFPGDRFTFEGFLPRRGGDRSGRIAELVDEPRTIVVFASPRRIAADLADLAQALGDEREVMVGRELTKLHEELWWGTLGPGGAYWSERDVKGEITLVIAGAPPRPPDADAAAQAAIASMASGVSMSQAVRDAASAHGVSRRELYDEVLRRQAAPEAE